jgi:crossover junction endodeoxyribonuclease RuvC
MIIMGIDPGTNLMGYAVVRNEGKKPRVLSIGALDMRKLDDHLDKLREIHASLGKLLELYTPDHLAIEAPFFHKDVQAMLKLGRAQGMAIAAAFARGVPVTEYLPKVVKKAVVGNGNASKEQVAGMLPHLVENLDMTGLPLDASDALGVAVCHCFQSSGMGGSKGKRYDSWGAFAKNNPDKIEKR